ALCNLARLLALRAIGTCSAANLATVERFGATAIDYRAGDFVASVRELTAGRVGGAGVDAAFDAIGGSHFGRSFACVAPGGILIGYGSQTMAIGREDDARRIVLGYGGRRVHRRAVDPQDALRRFLRLPDQ